MSYSHHKRSYHVALAVIGLLAAVGLIWGISKAASSPTVTSISPSNGTNSGSISISSLGGTDFVRGWNKETGLLSNWRMDESSGTNVADSSGNGNNGGATGTATTTGKLGNARDITSTTDTIDFGNIDNLSQTSSASFSFWWKGTPISNRSVLSKEENSGSYRGYSITHYNFGSGVKLVWDIGRNDIGGYRTYCGSSTSIPSDGAWHHYVITQSGGTSCANNIAMYFDGVKEQSLTEYDSGAGDANNTASLKLGSYLDGYTAVGSIDELRVYNQALTDAAVSALYTVTGLGGVKLTKSGQADIACTGFTLTNSTTLSNGSCDITSAAPGAWNVQLTNPDSGSGTLTNGFTVYSAAPTVASISPPSNAPILISAVVGTNFVRGWDKESGLLSNWRMDEASSTTVADSSGNGNNGTASGAVVASGHLGNARALTVNDTVDFGDIDNLSQTSTASLSFWWKASSTPVSNRSILNKVESSGSNRGYQVFHYDFGSGVKLVWLIGQGDVGGKRTYCASGTSIPTDGAWHHYVITQTGGTSCGSNVSMYFDGTKEQSLSQYDSGAGDSQGSTAHLKLGSYLDGYTAAGSIDELRVYNRTLSDDDVTALYNVSGSGSVKLTKSGQADIMCSGFTYSSSTALTNGSCDVTGAATGTWNVQVTNPDSRSGTLATGFTVH